MATVRTERKSRGPRAFRSLTHCVAAHSGPPTLQTYKLVGSERSGDKNRWNEDDLKFRSRTISRNNITLRDGREPVLLCMCMWHLPWHRPSSTYSIVGTEDNLRISPVKASYAALHCTAVRVAGRSH